jgi:hypothetical protein
MKPTMVVMAAGIGSRYGGIKQLDQFGPSGEKIIDYTIFDAIRAGFGKIVFVIRCDIQKDFEESVTKPWSGKIPMACVFQELDAIPSRFTIPADRKKPWGTAHAVLMAEPEVDRPFAVVNADDFYGIGALRIVGEFLGKPSESGIPEFCIAGYRLDQTLSEFGTVSRGICEADETGHLRRIVERTKVLKTDSGVEYEDGEGRHPIPPDAPVSMNLMGFTTALFPSLRTRFESFLASFPDAKAELYLPMAMDGMIHDGTASVRVLPTDESWFGVTYREDRPFVERSIQEKIKRGEYPSNVWA